MENLGFHDSKINAIFLGYLTRRYKRNIPINKCCSLCDKGINGTIHRYEKRHESNNAIIMYKSLDNEDKGMCSFSHSPISLAFYENNLYYCNQCYYTNKHINKCSVCLNEINKQISTKCNHTFCNNCLFKWIKYENKDAQVFKATCPLCRTNL